jgi:hypothetical protein
MNLYMCHCKKTGEINLYRIMTDYGLAQVARIDLFL